MLDVGLRRLGSTALVCLVCASCAVSSNDWSKAGVTPEESRRDREACGRVVAAERRMLEGGSKLIETVRFDRLHQLYQRCMQAKGYSL